MSANHENFDSDSLFRGNSALGIENPAFDGQRKAGKNAVAVADLEDALLLASKYTVNELVGMTGRNKTQIESIIKSAMVKVANFRGIDRAQIKSSFDEAQQSNGVHLRRFRETSVVGAVGDSGGRSIGLAPTDQMQVEPERDGAMGLEDGEMATLQDGMALAGQEARKMQEADGAPEMDVHDERTPGPVATAVMLIVQGEHQAAQDVLAAYGMH